ncbi:MAG: hypothetical protein PHU12_02445 [Candidatus Aenigmarchaeota archaeon]|nr:hypothetical protein [Candidatus Aenigmarchaeota archaeon]
MILGIIGALLILTAWAVEAEESIRKHKSMMDLKFAFLYAIATSFLIIHSYQIGDAVFYWFQIGLLAIILFEIFYSIIIKKVHKN